MDAREHLLGLAEAAAARRRGDACWIRDFRQEARDCFAREGLPGRRNEAWKYTRVAPVAKVAWALPPERPRPRRARPSTPIAATSVWTVPNSFTGVSGKGRPCSSSTADRRSGADI